MFAAAAKLNTLAALVSRTDRQEVDGSRFRKSIGRPPVDEGIERLIVRRAQENPPWGYEQIVTAMVNLGYQVLDQTVGNVLRRHDIPPAPERKRTTSWKGVIRAHMAVIGGNGFLHRRSAHVQRVEDVLYAIFPAPREQPNLLGRIGLSTRAGRMREGIGPRITLYLLAIRIVWRILGEWPLRPMQGGYMADFGNAGKLTIRTDKGAVIVRAGQQIHYTLTVSGATPVFTFACEHKARKSAEDFGPPRQTYEWDWQFPADADAPDDTYVVEMSFLTALKYTLRAELRTANGNMLSVLKDFDAESNDSRDKFPSSIEVIAQ